MNPVVITFTKFPPVDSPVSQPSKIVIATRESKLALWQAHYIQDRLRGLYPGCDVAVLGMTTRGDQILDRTLNKVGGKGLFVKELEQALERGEADIAVHSMKDVPAELPAGFALMVAGAREDPRDAFVSNQFATLAELPRGAIVGTSSLRRESQLRARFPHLKVEPLRGNVETRLRKLDEGQYAAIILAAAGLKRLGLAHRIRMALPPEDSIPAVGQGALGIEYRAERDDLVAWLAPLTEQNAMFAVLAERAFSKRLGGQQLFDPVQNVVDVRLRWGSVLRMDHAHQVAADAATEIGSGNDRFRNPSEWVVDR